jgi:hypothetical protein
MVSEFTPLGGFGGDSGEPPKYTGWYFDLFPDREHGAERAVDLVADYFTLTNEDQVRYLGIDKAMTGVFVVDTGGPPSAYVGPVAKPYEVVSPIAHRLDDDAARKATGKSAPWLSYVAAAKPEPPLAAGLVSCGTGMRVLVESTSSLGDVSVTLLDHHGDPVAGPVTRVVDKGAAAFAFDVPDEAVEGIHVSVKDLATSDVGHGRWDLVAGPGVYRAPYDPAGPEPNGFAVGSMAPTPSPEE